MEQGHPLREDPPDGQALGRGRLRHARRDAPVLRVKILLYILGGWLFALATKGVDGFTNVAQWWTEPIVFEKVVLYTMLFEVVGLGCGFGPLNNRFFPPLGSILYWLRPNTIRLPPWPNRMPLTKGTARTPVDVLLYGALLVMLLVALFSDGTGPIPALGTTIGVVPLWQIWTILGLLAVLGLRDKVIFLAARGEVYGSFAVAFLFAGYGVDLIIAAKLVCVAIWMGAATSKLNKHFPFVISTMMSNNPLIRTKWLKRKFFEKFPDDLRPGRVSRLLAHFSTAIEMLVPLALLFSHGGWPTAIAAFVMLCFHFGILSAIPMGVPLEWNVFMMFSVLALFVGHAEVGLSDMTTPLPVLLFALLAAIVVLGNLFPRKVSFLPGMRYYAGNWDTSLWCIKPSANEKIDRGLVAIASMPASQLEKFYGSKEQAMIFHVQGICVPRVQHSRPGAVDPCAQRDGGTQRRRVRASPRVNGVQHRRRLELRRRAHAQRAVDRRDAGALPLRTRRGPRHHARRTADPPADPAVPVGRRGDRRIRARLRPGRRHGDAPTVDRRHTRARRMVSRRAEPADRSRFCAITRSLRRLEG